MKKNNAALPDLEALFDKKDHLGAAALDRFVSQHAADDRLLQHLVELAESGDSRGQIITTALLKRYLERDIRFDGNLVARIFDLLASGQHWETTLHLLQMIPRLPIPSSDAERLCDLLYDISGHSNAFVRAWAYSALHHLAELHSEYRSDVRELLNRARRKESASIRARLRQLRPLES